MKIITNIKNYLFLKKVIKNHELITKARHPEEWIENCIKIAKRQKWPKNGLLRGLLSQAIKEVRKVHPYKLQKYDKAKKMYEDYFKLENHITSFEEIKQKVESGESVYISFFRREAPVKGKRWCEYYINGKGIGDGIEIYKCTGVKEFIYENKVHNTYIKYKSVKDEANTSEDYNYTSGSIDEAFLTCYLYATEDQIESFDQKVERVKQLESLVDEKQTEVRQLQREINQVCKFK